MELLKALEIISKDNTKKAVSKDFNGYIHRVVSTEVANEGKYVIVWNDGYNVKLSARILAADWEIQDKTTEEQESIDIVTYINKELGTSYDSEDEINYIDIIENYKFQLSEEFIDKIIQENDNEIWYDIIEYQKLSESFIRKHCTKFDKHIWSYITQYQTLSEEFIIEYQNYVDWYDVSTFQNFDVAFALKFQKRLTWAAVIRRRILPFDFYFKNIDIIERDDISELLYYYPKFKTMFRDYIKSLN
jgi:hypothetical protein